MFEFFRQEPLDHYPVDRFSLKSALLDRHDDMIVHVGGGLSRNHPREINLNVLPMRGVDVLGSAERLPLADASVGVIISCAVLEHVRDLNAAVREIERVLKPGGLVIHEDSFAIRTARCLRR